MRSFFTFSPSDTAIKIKLAISYAPHILQNHIKVRPYNGFLYVLNGAYTYTYEGGSFTAHAGDLIYLPARSVPYKYSIRSCGDKLEQTMQIEFELRRVSEEQSLSFGTHPVLIHLSDSNSVRYAMKAAISAHAKGTEASAILAVSELFRILALCTEQNAGQKNDAATKTVKPAIDYLEAHYTQPISSAELAALCHVSESQLRRAFLAATGMSPMAYKRHLLHMSAKNLLRVGEFKIGEVAEMLGFYDIYAFSHFFTHAEGIPPSEFCRLFQSSSQ